MFRENKKGFTLFESLLAFGITASISAGALKVIASEMEDDKQKMTAIELVSIVNAIDSRLSIDAYNSGLWTKTEWTNSTELVDDLLRKQLVSVDSRCKGEWIPELLNKNDTQLVDCNLWNKIPYGMNASANMKLDGSGYINDFNLVLAFKTDKHFEDKFMNIQKVLSKTRSLTKKESAGSQFYSFAEKSTLNEVTKVECMGLKSECVLLGNFNRDGVNGYVRIDGSSSIVANHLSFVETKEDNTPIQCMLWHKDTVTSAWNSTQEDCGIGVYSKDGTPIPVEVAVNGLTTDNVLLDKECNVFGYDVALKTVVDTAKKSPCGMLNDGSVIQIVDKVNAAEGYFDKIYADDVKLNKASINSIVSDSVNTKALLVLNNFEVRALEAKFKNNVKIDKKLTAGNIDVVGSVTASQFRSNSIMTNAIDADAIEVDDLNVVGVFTVKDADITALKTATLNVTETSLFEDDVLMEEVLHVKNKIKVRNLESYGRVSGQVGEFANIRSLFAMNKDKFKTAAYNNNVIPKMYGTWYRLGVENWSTAYKSGCYDSFDKAPTGSCIVGHKFKTYNHESFHGSCEVIVYKCKGMLMPL